MSLVDISGLGDGRKKGNTKPPLMPAALLTRRDLDERDRILMEHVPQVSTIARRIHNRLPQHVPLEDLVQTGVLGLIEAFQHFDPTRNVQLKSYARMRIQGAIFDGLRELDWSPRTLRKRARQLEEGHQTLRARLGRAPSEAELAAEVGLSLEGLQQLVGELHGLDLASLHALGSEDTSGDELLSCLPCGREEDPRDLCLRSEMNALLARAVGELPPRKRQVLALYYFEELTMKEVGRALGVGESRVSQIHTAAVAQLKVRMRELLEPRPPERPRRGGEQHDGVWETAVPGLSPSPIARCVKMQAEEPFGWEEGPGSLHWQLPPSRSAHEGATFAYHYAPRHIARLRPPSARRRAATRRRAPRPRRACLRRGA